MRELLKRIIQIEDMLARLAERTANRANNNESATAQNKTEIERTADRVEENTLVSDITFVVLAENEQIDDVTCAEHSSAFPVWVAEAHYVVGNIRRYETDGKLYKCLTEHDSNATWTPDVSPSLWVNISDPAEEYPEWSQPIASTDAYNMGDKVSHDDKHWTSDYDGNVWEPGVYGWSEIVEQSEE